MSIRYDRKQTEFKSMGLDPCTLANVIDRNDGQLAVVTDQGRNRLYVREDGYLVPAIEPDIILVGKTLEDFQIFVNPSTGTTPESGTIVYNQADASEVGTVATVQDALDILPIGIEHHISIICSDGYHYGKTTNSGRPGIEAFVSIRAFKSIGQQYTESSYPAIRIYGAATIVDEVQSGVLAATTITRDSGEWDVDTMKGRHVVIESGSGVGNIIPIVSNTTTVLTIPTMAASGACTFRIEEYSSYCLCSLDGATSTSNGIIIHSDCEPIIEFYQLSLGYNTIPMKDVSSGKLTRFYYCQVITNNTWSSSGADNTNQFTITKTFIIYI